MELRSKRSRLFKDGYFSRDWPYLQHLPAATRYRRTQASILLSRSRGSWTDHGYRGRRGRWGVRGREGTSHGRCRYAWLLNHFNQVSILRQRKPTHVHLNTYMYICAYSVAVKTFDFLIVRLLATCIEIVFYWNIQFLISHLSFCQF